MKKKNENIRAQRKRLRVDIEAQPAVMLRDYNTKRLDRGALVPGACPMAVVSGRHRELAVRLAFIDQVS